MNIYLFCVLLATILIIAALFFQANYDKYRITVIMILSSILISMIIATLFLNHAVIEEVKSYQVIDLSLAESNLTTKYSVAYLKDADTIKLMHTSEPIATDGETRVSTCIQRWGFLTNKEEKLYLNINDRLKN